MKHLLALLIAALLGLAAFSSRSTTSLTGKVTGDTGEALIGAIVKILKDTSLIQGTITDANGDYRLQLEPGTYDVEVSYVGYETRRTIGVQVLADQQNTLDIVLAGGAVLNEVVVTGRSAPAPREEKIASIALRTESGRSKARKGEGRAAGKEKGPAPVTAKPASAPKPIDGGSIEIRGSRSEPTEYFIDGKRDKAVTLETKPAILTEETYNAAFAMDDERPTEPPVHPGAPEKPNPRAGLLTAGEWNDLHNWNTHWADLLKDGETDAFQKMYNFFPKHRYSVLLQTADGLPISDVAVQLLDRSGKTVWEARTSNTGMAELWAGMFDEKKAAAECTLTADVDGKRRTLGTAKPYSEGINQYKIQRECRHSKTVDIVWTVDATGSMGDELEYLKTELLDVIGRVQAANPDLDVRTGTVFYRDQGDDYIVKSSALNRDLAKTVDYIRKQSAGGGGDYPEAVHSALEETLRQPWSREAVARICFLVLDASPHQSPDVLESLQKNIREAARKGIRIVPVSASGIQKDTEFLMKFFGLATNGSYVFLTDHSGIGGKHLEPTTDEYKVELLNDLLARVITEYTTVPTCDGKSSILFAADRQDNDPAPKPVQYYPNPAVSSFNLDLPFEADKVTLYDAEGKAVYNLAQVQAGAHTIPVHTLPPGFYTLRIWKAGQVQSGKVLVVRT